MISVPSGAILSLEMYGNQRKGHSLANTDTARAPFVVLYAERIERGLDLWTGRPSAGAREEAERIRDQSFRSRRGGRKSNTN